MQEGFFLTYSQLPQRLTPESVIFQLQKQTGIKRYVIGDELHENGDRHFHVILISDRKVDIRSASKFDIKFEGKTYKGHCKGVQNLAGLVEYVRKDNLYLTSLKHIHNGVFMPRETIIPSMLKKKGKYKTLKYVADNLPKSALGGKSLTSLEKHIDLLL